MINTKISNHVLANQLSLLLKFDAVESVRFFRLYKNGQVKFFYLNENDIGLVDNDFEIIQNKYSGDKNATLAINKDFTDFIDIFLFDFSVDIHENHNSIKHTEVVDRLKCVIDVIYMLKPDLTKYKQGYYYVDFACNQRKSLIADMLNLSSLDMAYLQKISLPQSTKEIACMFGVSDRTLEKKISELIKKFNVSNKSHLQILLRYISEQINTEIRIVSSHNVNTLNPDLSLSII